jgi:hypothetical protein
MDPQLTGKGLNLGLAWARPFAAQLEGDSASCDNIVSTAADTVACLEHEQGVTGLGYGRRGCEPGKPGSDDEDVVMGGDRGIGRCFGAFATGCYPGSCNSRDHSPGEQATSTKAPFSISASMS